MTAAPELTEYVEDFTEREPGERLRVMTISQATDLWLGELERKNHSERTIGTYRRLLDWLDEAYRSIDVEELSPEQIRRFLDSQARTKKGRRKSAATIAQNVSIVCNFFDWLDKEGVITRNPTRRNGERIVSRPRQPSPEENDNVVTVSTHDVLAMLEMSKRMTMAHKLAVHAAVYLGPRRRALAQARISDYDQIDRTLLFREKGGKQIRKPVPDELADVIDDAIRGGCYPETDSYLIPSTAQTRKEGGRDDRIVWRLVKEVAAAAGVESHVHALRAAFAVQYLRQNPGQVVALQKLMGHRRVETTMVYLRRLDRQEQMESVRSLTWGASEIPAISEESLDASRLAEKEGFEPSFPANADGSGAGTHSAADAPRGGRS